MMLGVATTGTATPTLRWKKIWRFWGHPGFSTLPDPKPMTVPYFVPSRSEPCIGYIGAVTGSVKTFTADDLAVAISSGGTFAGQQVTERGAVVLIEMEGS